MKTLKLLTPILLLAALSGCAGEYYPISDETIQKGGEYTKDASVAKEAEVHKTLRNRDNKYAAVYKTSGTKITFEMVQVSPGVYVQVMKELVMKESPRFDTPLPQNPSVHPMWKTLEILGGAAIQWTGIFGLANQAAGVMNKATENVGTHYNGPYAPISDSYNQTAEPFFAPLVP